MTIRFDFTVSDEEASTLFDLVSTAIADARFQALAAPQEPERDWHVRHAAYLEALRAKMHNRKLKP